MSAVGARASVLGYAPAVGPHLPVRELTSPATGSPGRHLLLTTEAAESLLETLASAASAWRAVPLPQRATAIARAAEALRRPGHPGRRQALAAGAAWTGRAEGMLADSLDFFLGKLRRHALLEEAKRCGLESTAEARDGGAPALVLHWLAGNTPWAGLESLAVATLGGSASLVKVARAEPVFASMFAQALAASHPILAEALVVAYWDGATDTALDSVLAARLAAVVAFGSDASIRSLHARFGRGGTSGYSGGWPRRFIAHGHRLSVAVLGEAAWRAGESSALAERVALDHVLEDQSGCLSPRGVYLVGEIGEENRAEAAHLAHQVATALEVWERRWPRAPIATHEAVRVQQLRDVARLRGGRVWAPPDATAWTVLLETGAAAEEAFEPSPEARFVHLRHCASLETALASLRPLRGVLSTVACDGFPPAEEAARKLARDLAPDRLCATGTMQRPPLGWNHDGASDLALLLGTSEVP